MKKILSIPLLLISLVPLVMLANNEATLITTIIDKGFTPFLAVGILVSPFFWITIFGAFFKWGLSWLLPHKFGEPVMAKRYLIRIYKRELTEEGFIDTGERTEIPYGSYTDMQLSSIYDRIDRDQVPDRFNHLMAEICRRVGKERRSPAEEEAPVTPAPPQPA